MPPAANPAPPPPAAHAAPSARSILAALEHLALAAEIEFDRSRALQAWRAAEEAPEKADLPWSSILSRAALEVGLNLYVIRRSLEDVIRSADPSAPWLTYSPEAGVFLAVHQRSGRKVEVSELRSTVRKRKMPLSELKELVPISEDGTALWVIAEQAAPLANLRTPPGAESHDGHGMHPARRIMAMLRAERADLWVVVIYSVLIGLFSLAVPTAVQSLVNTVAFGTVVQPLVVLTIALLVVLGFSSILSAMRLYVVEMIQRRVFVRVAADFTFRLTRVKSQAFDKMHGPELVNRFFDVVTVQKSGAMLLIDGMAIFMQSGVGMILLALYHPYLLVFDILLLAAILWVLFGLGRGAVATSVKESKLKYAVAAWLEEIARHMVTFKSGAGTTLATKHADSLVQEYLHARKKHFRIVLRQAGGSLGLQAVASAVLLGIGGWLVMDGELTLGQLVAAELIVTAVVGGFAKFGKHLEVFYDLAAAMDKLGQVIDLPLERSGGASLPVEGKPARVEFHKLSFGYSNKKPILNEVSWTLESGVRAAVMGPSGMGKSATADLLYGLRSPVTGTIFLDGVDYRDLSLQSLRSHVALVRSAEVFSGTIAENISLGRAGIGHREIREALGMVGLLDEVSTLPAGIDTHLSTGGLPLSPGQTARLMIARALAGQPRLLILDETLDQIDDVREREVLYQHLFHQDAPWTLLVITHSPEVLQHCQEIYGLADGKLTEIPPFRKPERSE